MLFLSFRKHLYDFFLLIVGSVVAHTFLSIFYCVFLVLSINENLNLLLSYFPYFLLISTYGSRIGKSILSRLYMLVLQHFLQKQAPKFVLLPSSPIKLKLMNEEDLYLFS